MKNVIIPAIIAKKQNELDSKLARVMNYVDLIQLDIMDNIFVPNSSLFFDFSLPKTNCKFEAHLMIQNPEEWIKKFGNKVDTILVHYESDYNPDNLIKSIKKLEKKFGFVLNPETKSQRISKYINALDQVLIMTVNPGFYGSPFLPDMLEKISEIRSMKETINIEVDGGITDKTIKLVENAGANMFVSGSYIVKSENVLDSIKNLKDKLKN